MKEKLLLHTVFMLALLCSFQQIASAQTLTDSNLPIVIINTDGGEQISDDPKIFADMIILYHKDGSRNFVVDKNNPDHQDYAGKVKIETRGSSSQALDKKAYGFTTYLADGVDKDNVSLLGMPKENDWILGGLAFDSVFMRDYISYTWSTQMGNYAPGIKYCELILNGNYRGLYVLVEKIKADDNRVNIDKITELDLTLPNLSGGYITKADRADGNPAWSSTDYLGGNIDYVHVVPKPDESKSQQTNYIKNVFRNLDNAAASNNTSLSNGYPSIIDIPSFIDFMMINELSSNVDAYQLSTYFHKDKNGKLRAGPLWDLNLAYGRDLGFRWGSIFDRSKPDVWQFDNGDNVGSKFWLDLYRNDEYRCYWSKRWNELTAEGQLLHLDSMNTFIDQTADYISEAIEREDQKWGTAVNFESEVDYLKSFLSQRVTWMTDELGDTDACSAVTTPPLVISKIHYHPIDTQSTNEKDQEFISITNNSETAVDLSGVYFAGTGLVYQFPFESSLAANTTITLAGNELIYNFKYEEPAFGQFTRSLSNDGETIRLADAWGNLIDEVTYNDKAPWPDADGNGSFLVLNDANTDNNNGANWGLEEDVDLTLNSVDLLSTELEIFPNPTQNLIHLSATAPVHQILVYDMQGRIMLDVAQPNIQTLDLGTLDTGVLLLKIMTAETSYIRRIIKY
ncbi:MAG: CotH kinase family protein [Reichenbachiella sp.]